MITPFTKSGRQLLCSLKKHAFHLLLLLALLPATVIASAANPVSATFKALPPASIASFAPASGAPGTLIKIKGGGFTGATQVTVGNKAAIIISVADTAIVAMVMPDNVTGSVKVTTAGGTVLSSAANFTVTATPFPAVQQGAKLIDSTKRSLQYGNQVLAQQGSIVLLSADGNTAIVSGSQGSFYGAYLLYTRVNGKWMVTKVFSASPDFFISPSDVSLSADGNTVLIGNEVGSSQSAILYKRNNNVWATGETLNDALGSTVSLSADGKTAILGKQARGGNYGGGGYTPQGISIMKLIGNTWQAQAVPDVPVDSAQFEVFHQQEYDQDGAPIPYQPQHYYAYTDIPGNLVAISADGKTAASVSFARYGRYSYRFALGYTVIYALTPAGWAVQTKLPQSEHIKLSADGNTFVSDGNVYVRTGNAWSLQQQLGASGAASVSADGNTVVFAGEHLLVYTRIGTTWTQREVQPENPPADVDPSYPGRTAALSADGTVAFLGVPGDRTVPINDYYGNLSGYAGSVTAYTVTPPTAIASVSPTTGPVGTLVKITGVSLEGATLNVGGKDAIVVSNTGTVITGMVMPGAVTGPVSVTKGSTVTGGNFTVTATLYPNVPQSGALVDTTYTKPQTATAGDVKVSQGSSVAVSADGNTAMVGTGQANTVVSTGGVLFYKRTNGVWVKDGPLLGTNYATVTSVALSADGNTAVSGSKFSRASAAIVYSRINGVWTVTGNTYGANVGISADGNTVIAGTELYYGTAYMLKRDGDTWVNVPIPGNDNNVGPNSVIPGNSRQYFTARVAISADSKTMVVVVPGTPQRTNYAPGITNIYTRASVTDGFTLERTMPEIGVAVALNADGNTMLVDNAIVYTRPGAGSAYTQLTTIPGGGQATMSADAKTIMYSANGPVAFTLNGSTYSQQTVSGIKYAGSSIGISADGTTAFLGNNSDTSTVIHPPAQHGPIENTAPAFPLGAAYAFVAGTPVNAPGGYATALTFTNTTGTSTTLSWTKGNGGLRAVFIGLKNSAAPLPANYTTYLANAAYKLGTQLGTSGWYCVYNGNGSTVNITNLLAGNTYRAEVIEYNGTNGGEQYNTTRFAPADVTTVSPGATVQASAITFADKTGTTTTINWVNGNGTGRVVFINNTDSGAPLPADVYYSANTRYTSGNQIGTTGWYCVYNGTGNTVNVTGLGSGKSYRVAVVEYSGSIAAPKYLTTGIVPANLATPIEAPTGYATALTFSNTTPTSSTLSWVNGNGVAREVFIKVGTGGGLSLVDGVGYAANNPFTQGFPIVNGWYCVYKGTGSSVNLLGLSPTTTYSVVVVEYNGSGFTGGVAYGKRFNSATVVTPAQPGAPTSAPTGYAISYVFSNTTATSSTLSWTSGNGAGRAVFIRVGTDGGLAPVDGVAYTAGNPYIQGTAAGNGWYCVYKGTGSSVNLAGLSPTTTYRVSVIDYNGSGNTDDVTYGKRFNSGNFTTLMLPNTPATPPTGYATGIAFSNTAAITTTLSWVNSNGAARAAFVKLGNGAFPVTQGTTYSSNGAFGAGAQVGTSGWYCVYNGTGNTVNLTGLAASSTYRAIVIEYNGTAGTEGYNLSRYNAANVTTTVAPILLLTTNQKKALVQQDLLTDDATPELNIHQGMSPNADGVNDVFTIDGIGAYPENTVKVINTNGEVIYNATSYNNYNIAFDGHAANGTLQKAGTYFYSVEYKKGAEVVHKTGYLVIKY